MLQCKVLITPFFEADIEVSVMPIAGQLHGAMKMLGVFFVGVIGREICAPAKPVCVTFFKIPKVGMDRGNHRAARMEHKRNACRKELGSAAARDLRGKLL